ncbi:MAG: hypothetical protein RR233_08240 [Clostridiales bacterium]
MFVFVLAVPVSANVYPFDQSKCFEAITKVPDIVETPTSTNRGLYHDLSQHKYFMFYETGDGSNVYYVVSSAQPFYSDLDFKTSPFIYGKYVCTLGQNFCAEIVSISRVTFEPSTNKYTVTRISNNASSQDPAQGVCAPNTFLRLSKIGMYDYRLPSTYTILGSNFDFTLYDFDSDIAFSEGKYVISNPEVFFSKTVFLKPVEQVGQIVVPRILRDLSVLLPIGLAIFGALLLIWLIPSVIRRFL